MQQDLLELSNWLACNKLSLNVSKTKAMILAKDAISYENFDLYLNNEIIDLTNEFKFLGITYDNNTNFSLHAQEVVNKVKFYTYQLRCIRKFLSKESALIYYYAFINSRLQYGIQIWYPLLSSKLKQELNNSFVKASKLVGSNTKLLDPETLCTLDMVKFVYQYENLAIPKGLRVMLPSNADIHHYNTRGKNTPRVIKHKSKQLNSGFIVKCSSYWNKLPVHIQCSKSSRNFQKIM